MSAGAVNIRLGAVVSDFIAGFQRAGAAVGALTQQLNGNLAAGFAAADRQSRQFDRGLGRLADNVKNVGQTLSTYVTLPLAGLGVASLKSAADMEQAGVSFRVLLKDANLAAATINDLKAFAASTPFEFTDVQAGAKQLLSYGFAVGDLKTLLSDAGNLASGFGVQIGEVTRLLGRIKSGDFGEAFERLRDFGIGRDLLEAKGLKFDKSGQYQGSVKQAFDVIQTVIRERFGGQMEEQSKTLGGIFSNLKDQASFALTDIGQKLVETFNLKELGAGLVDTIGKLRDGFLALPAPIQKGVVVLGAVLAIAGPLALALGGILALVPSIISGWAAITTTLSLSLGPIAAIGAAVVAAGYLIVTNWDSIKKVLTDSGIWETTKRLVTSAIGTVTAVFSKGIALLTALWDRFGNSIKIIASAAFDAVAVIFNTVGGALSGVFKLVTGVLTGDWQKFSEGLQNITVSLFNAITGLFTAGFKGILGLSAGLLRSVGLDSAAKSLETYANSLEAIKIKLQDTTKAANQTAQAIQLPEVTVTAKKTSSGSISGLSSKTNSDTDTTTFSKLDTLRRLAGGLEEQIQALDGKAPQRLYDQLAAIRREIERIQELANAKPVDLGKLTTLNISTPSTEAPKLPYLDKLTQWFQESRQKVQEQAAALRDTLGIAKEQLAAAGVGLLEGFGNAIGSGQNPLQSLLKSVVGFIADFIIKLGSAILLAGKLEEGAAALTGPFGALFALSGAAKIAAGIGLVVGGSAIKALGSFADGGIVSGPTLGLVGEYAGAKNNPEVIAPLDKLKTMIGGAGGRVQVYGRFELENNVLAAAVEQYYQNDSRYR